MKAKAYVEIPNRPKTLKDLGPGRYLIDGISKASLQWEEEDRKGIVRTRRQELHLVLGTETSEGIDDTPIAIWLFGRSLEDFHSAVAMITEISQEPYEAREWLWTVGESKGYVEIIGNPARV